MKLERKLQKIQIKMNQAIVNEIIQNLPTELIDLGDISNELNNDVQMGDGYIRT